MDVFDRQTLRARYGGLRDDALLREALRESGDLVLPAREEIAEALSRRFGPFDGLVAREAARAGSLWGRIHHTLGFARLRAPGEPMLGGRDVPPYDGILFLATGGLGFLPTSASSAETFLDFAPEALEGPIAAWLGPTGARPVTPPGAPRPLPLPLRARLDEATAWIDAAVIVGIGPHRRELRVHVARGGDAVFRLEEAAQREVLGRWAEHVGIPFESP